MPGISFHYACSLWVASKVDVMDVDQEENVLPGAIVYFIPSTNLWLICPSSIPLQDLLTHVIQSEPIRSHREVSSS